MNTLNPWPPQYFARLQDGNGEGSYFRSMRPEEEVIEFADRIGALVARDIEYQGTLFIDAIDGTSGEVDVPVSELIITAMNRHKTERIAMKSRLAEA